MTKSLSKKTIAVVIIAIVLAALAVLSPVLLNSRSQKQGKENATAASDNSETDKQANTASVKAENTVAEGSEFETATAEINPNTAGTARSNAQNQSAPDNDIPADGSNTSASTEEGSHPNNAGSANSPTAAPDNDIKAE